MAKKKKVPGKKKPTTKKIGFFKRASKFFGSAKKSIGKFGRKNKVGLVRAAIGLGGLAVGAGGVALSRRKRSSNRR